MEDTKKWYESKAVVAGLVGVIAAGVNQFTGYTVGEDLTPLLTDNLSSAIALVASMFAIYGRVKATKKIG